MVILSFIWILELLVFDIYAITLEDLLKSILRIPGEDI